MWRFAISAELMACLLCFDIDASTDQAIEIYSLFTTDSTVRTERSQQYG